MKKGSATLVCPKAPHRLSFAGGDTDLSPFVEREGGTEIPVYDGKLDLAKAAIAVMSRSAATGFDLFLHSDVPPGSGLGSCSAGVEMWVVPHG